MIISQIFAMGKGHELGRANDLLWHLPDDFRHFKQSTQGHHILMGRKTYESFGSKPLKNRPNLVVSRNPEQLKGDITGFKSIQKAIEFAEKNGESELFIIGGAEIYKQTLDKSRRLYITMVDASFPDADTFYPELEPSQWDIQKITDHSIDDRHNYPFSIFIYNRV